MRARRRRDDRGAALVEFALVVPVLAMLLFGMITAATSWDRSMSLSHAARLGGRYGATLPTSGQTSLDAWLTLVSARTVSNAEGNLNVNVAGRQVCVAYVHPDGSTALDQTRRRVENTAGTASYANSTCFNDGQADSEKRVQVDVQRTTVLEAILWKQTITVHETAVFRYEVANGL